MKPIYLTLAAALLACSNDDPANDADGTELPCVKVTYPSTDAGAGHEDACPDYPSVCGPTDNPCHGDNAECIAAVEALCGAGTKMHACVAATLNGRAASLQIHCEHQPSDDD